MDSNHRSPARKSRFLLRKANCGTERGQPKRVVSYTVPMVRIHLPPVLSPVRTGPELGVQPPKLSEVELREAGRMTPVARSRQTAIIPPASRPCAGPRNKWLRTT